ncbi:hypothetical protein [Ferruginibacter sp.]
MKLKYSLNLIFCCLPFIVFAQDLTGTWEGSVGGNYCKIVIFHVNDSCFGYTYDTGMGYCKANFTATYDSSKKKFKGKNTNFIEHTPTHALSTYHLHYSKRGNIEYLSGTASAKSIGAKLLSFGMPFPVQYKRTSDQIDTTALIAAKVAYYKDKAERIPATNSIPKDTIKDVVKAPVVINTDTAVTDLVHVKESRTSKLSQTIETTADSIKLVLYDNGDIDGDTVTVFDNGKMIIDRLGLGVKPYEVVIPLDKNNRLHAIELMANNLGSIPPNTAYMLILAGKERYELRLSSDFSVNAQVNIQFKVD